jgi:hypothetical protein
MNRRLFMAVMASVTTSAKAGLYDDYINSTSKKPFVAFLGRIGVPGHAFIGVGVDLNSDLRVYERLFGLYPDSAGKLSSLKLIFGKTSGKLDYQWADLKWDTSYVKQISDAERSAVIAQMELWAKNAPKYSLLGNGGKNCNILAEDVAKSLKLKVPDGAGTTLPWHFIDKLKLANSPK